MGQYEHMGIKKLVIFEDALDKFSSINGIRLLSLYEEKASFKIMLACSQVELFPYAKDDIFTICLNPLHVMIAICILKMHLQDTCGKNEDQWFFD